MQPYGFFGRKEGRPCSLMVSLDVKKDGHFDIRTALNPTSTSLVGKGGGGGGLKSISFVRMCLVGVWEGRSMFSVRLDVRHNAS